MLLLVEYIYSAIHDIQKSSNLYTHVSFSITHQELDISECTSSSGGPLLSVGKLSVLGKLPVLDELGASLSASSLVSVTG